MNKDKEIDDIVAPIPQAKTNYWLVASISLGIVFIAGVIAFSLGFFNNNPQANSPTNQTQVDLKIKGNRNSKIYHLQGCPNYNDIAEKAYSLV